MFVLLVRPKGSGKSHIGRTLESISVSCSSTSSRSGSTIYAECQAAGRQPMLSEGVGRVHPLIAAALRSHEHVCVETTGASAEILDDLLSLEEPSKRLVARVRAPLD
jgi:hypothetical protein